MATAQIAVAAPTLVGERFDVARQEFPAHVLVENCPSFPFEFSGTATGPFPGTFRETGSLTVGLGRVQAFQASFTITSPNGTVTGTASLDSTVPQSSGNQCGPEDIDLRVPVKYTADITTGGVTYRESGIGDARYDATITETSALGVVEWRDFGQSFTASSAPCSDGRDNDGDQKIDFPADPGCSSATDSDEKDPVKVVAKALHNKGAGLLSYTLDGSGSTGINRYDWRILQNGVEVSPPLSGITAQYTFPSTGRYEVELGGCDTTGNPIVCDVHRIPVVVGLHVGVITDKTKLVTGSAMPKDSACPVDLEVRSSSRTVLWAELKQTEGVAADPSNPAALLHVLGPGGLVPATFTACFSDVNEQIHFRVDTTSPLAQTLQIIELAVAFTGRSVSSLLNDVQLLGRVMAAVPPSFIGVVAVCPDCAPAALALTVLFHRDELAHFFTTLADALPDIAIVRQLGSLFSEDSEETKDFWADARKYIEQALFGTKVDNLIDRDLNSAERDEAVAQVKHADVEARKGEQQLRVDEQQHRVNIQKQVVAENEALLQECIAHGGPGCTPEFINRLSTKTLPKQRLVLARKTDVLTKLTETLRVLTLRLESLANQVVEAGKVVKRLKNVAKYFPVVGGFISEAETIAERWSRAASGTAQGNLFFVSCAPEDRRPACR